MRRGHIPKVPPFLNDIFLTMPSINGPAIMVASIVAMKDDKLVSPTADSEKLYGGAEKIWDSVMDIPTSQEIQVVKSNVAHTTAGEASIVNGRTMVLSKETWFTYPLYGSICFAKEWGCSMGTSSATETSGWVSEECSWCSWSIFSDDGNVCMAYTVSFSEFDFVFDLQSCCQHPNSQRLVEHRLSLASKRRS